MSTSIKRSVLIAISALSLGFFGAPRDAEAMEIANPSQCKGNHEAGIVCVEGSTGSSQDYGPSDFLGAFASAKEAGGWVEFYSDKGGEWSIEHHKDGTTTVQMPNTNTGFATPIDNQSEGGLVHKPRPKPKGVSIVPMQTQTFAQAKAAAYVSTGSFNHLHIDWPYLDWNAQKEANPTAKITINGTGKCSAFVVVSQNGSPVMTTPVSLTLPATNYVVNLPRSQGGYSIELVGKNGCMTSTARVAVSVKLTAVSIPKR